MFHPKNSKIQAKVHLMQRSSQPSAAKKSPHHPQIVSPCPLGVPDHRVIPDLRLKQPLKQPGLVPQELRRLQPRPKTTSDNVQEADAVPAVPGDSASHCYSPDGTGSRFSVLSEFPEVENGFTPLFISNTLKPHFFKKIKMMFL